MIRRSTWIVLGVFVGLLALALLLPRLQESREAEATPTETPYIVESLFNATDLVLVQIELASKEGQSLVLQRDLAQGDWLVAGAEAGTTDVFASGSLAGQILGLTIAQTLENPPSLSEMGLSAPAYTITMAQDTGEQIVLKIGNPIPTGGGYYAQVGIQQPVVLNDLAVDSILAVLAAPPLLPTATPTATPEAAVSETPDPALVDVTPTP